MSTEQQRPPLWKVIREAYEKARMGPPGSDYAAEIRAVRDWLVPEEGGRCPLSSERYACSVRSPFGLRALLTAEADRAERGDHG